MKQDKAKALQLATPHVENGPNRAVRHIGAADAYRRDFVVEVLQECKQSIQQAVKEYQRDVDLALAEFYAELTGCASKKVH